MKVLIVADEELRELVKKQLFELGCTELIWAGDGESAIQHLHQSLFTLVITAFRLPRMDGLEVAKRVRDHCRPPLPKVILMASRKKRDVIKRDVRSCCVDALLYVPFDQMGLKGVIERVCADTILRPIGCTYYTY